MNNHRSDVGKLQAGLLVALLANNGSEASFGVSARVLAKAVVALVSFGFDKIWTGLLVWLFFGCLDL